MLDIKVVTIKDLLQIVPPTEYARLPGGAVLQPVSLIINGKNFDRAQEVFINDLRAPEFLIVSPTRLIAQIPAGQEKSQIRKLSVFSERPFPGQRSKFFFEIGTTIKVLQGIEKMVQIFCKLLMQTPGSDKFSPSEGGGLLSFVGRNVENGADKALTSAVVSAVTRTKDLMISKQNKNQRIPPDERLLTATTDRVGFDPNTTTLAAVVNLTAVSGDQAVANLSFGD